jgi:hypothetical protein
MLIDAEWNFQRLACYSPERLSRLYDRPHTPMEVWTRTDGPWATVPRKDRMWVLWQLLDFNQLRQIACDLAESNFVKSTPQFCRDAITVARKYDNVTVGFGKSDYDTHELIKHQRALCKLVNDHYFKLSLLPEDYTFDVYLTRFATLPFAVEAESNTLAAIVRAFGYDSITEIYGKYASQLSQFSGRTKS